ncbi:MAG: ArsR/SmtB family transcription factor [bacterium]
MALADSTRRDILLRLCESDCTVSELAAPFNISLPAVSKHVRILEKAGLLERKREGRIQRCRLKARPMKDASEWIDKYRVFWEKQFDSLEKYLQETKHKGGVKYGQ